MARGSGDFDSTREVKVDEEEPGQAIWRFNYNGATPETRSPISRQRLADDHRLVWRDLYILHTSGILCVMVLSSTRGVH